ncbi:MAG TPA: hypothetical protein VGA61_10695, partial [Anaerolineae bacterium]
MSDLTELVPQRPRFLAPGTREWLVEQEGPRLVKRLVDEVHAGQVGEMTPTQARCAAMLMDRVLPAMSAVHHTVEGDLQRLSTEEIKAQLKAMLGHDVQDVPMRDLPTEATAPEQAASVPRQTG